MKGIAPLLAPNSPLGSRPPARSAEHLALQHRVEIVGKDHDREHARLICRPSAAAAEKSARSAARPTLAH